MRSGNILALALIFVGGLAVAVNSAGLAEAEEPWVESGWSGGDLPNVSMLLRSISSSDPAIEATLLPAVRNIAGVESAFVDVLPGGPPVVHLVVPDAGDLESVKAQLNELSAGIGEGELLVGGQLVYDTEVEGTIGVGLLAAVIPVLIVLGFLVAALYGTVIGIGTAVATGLAALMGGLIGSSMAGAFDGTIATTVVPGALAGLLVGVTICFRLISWFKHPPSDDSADNILRAVKSQVPDLVIVLGMLAICMLVSLFTSATPAAIAVFTGALCGALTALATMPPLLSTRGAVPDNAEFRAVPVRVPDGRDLPVAVIFSVAVILLGLGLFAARSSSSNALIDAESSPGEQTAQVAILLNRLGGDPAAAIRATGSGGTTEDFAEWAQSASRFSGVGWVATSAGRFEEGELVAIVGEPAPIDDRTAIINPAESARSALTQQTVRALREIDTAIVVELEGLPVSAEARTNGSTTGVWVLVGLLAVLGGAVVFYLLGDLGLGIVAVALRLISSAASLGVAHLIIDSPTSSQLAVLVLVLSTGITLFEIGLLRMIVDAEEPESNFVSTAMRSGGGHAIAGLAVLALVGIGLLASSVKLIAAFGIALAVAVMIEIVLGIWLLRPVILGEQALRSAVPSLNGRSILGRRGPREGEPVNPEWRRVVAGLLREEFRFQTEPDDADLGTVFVEDTPLFGELAQHNLRLRQNGLKIRGEGPSVISVKAVNDGDPVTVAITVDHPSRQLLASDGRLLGVRAAERRDGMLWLAQDPSGRYRIAEAVDMGSGVPIPEESPVKAEAKAK